MAVGLDIGTKTIKMVELSRDGEKWKMRASGVIGYSGTSIDQMNSDREFSLLAGAIKKLHKEAQISSKDVAIALPESLVYTRTVKFPLLTESEISSAVKWEAEQYIPLPKEEAIIQHEILERREETTPPSTLVLLVAAPKELVAKFAKVVEMAGLKLVSVETELMSLVRALSHDKGTSMIVDFGARSTDISIAKNGQLSFSRSISTAGDAFTRAVAQRLGIDIVQAEEYKKTYGLSDDQLEGKIRDSLAPVLLTVGDEIKKAIQFYKSDSQGESPKSVLFTGGTASMLEIGVYFSKMLGIEVAVGNPFANIVLTPETSKSLAEFAPLYSVSVGLAMREE